MPPEFGDQAYWSTRFQQDPNPFEWLVTADKTSDLLQSILKHLATASRIFHIGCGTSDLSLQLRAAAPDSADILNVDYASEALVLGQKRELERFKTRTMHWQQLDLMNPVDVVALIQPDASGLFDLIVDKSTTDAIVCSRGLQVHGTLIKTLLDANLCSFYAEDILGAVVEQPDRILMLYMALVTRPGGSWVCISYSNGRFDGMRNGRWAARAGSLEQLVAELWTLERREEVVVGGQEENSDGRIVHRPRICHHLYVLKRTAAHASVARTFLDRLNDAQSHTES